ncbi:MAG TPA: ABC transporter substrate-binding protein [Stellaceae bacterium]|nr:ABC transporter substrate-binding protein [Stellaceae bacterium]
MLRRLFFVLLLLLASVPARAAIVVGSKIDTEGALLGNMIVLLLKQHGLAATAKLQLGPTEIVRRALIAGEIDIYPEYTGNGAFFFHQENDPVWRDADKGYARVKELDRARNRLVWLAPAPANNTWAIAVRRDLKLGTLEEFARYVDGGGTVRLAASAEFASSPGGLPSFEKTYGFKLARRQLVTLAGGNTAATIRAAAEHISGVNAGMAYGTDGALSVLGLVALRDDKGAQVVYRPAPVAREAVMTAHPEIASLLDPVFATLTLRKLQMLNARIAVEGFDARAVAADYLRSLE